jgi:hypothetical protein
MNQKQQITRKVLEIINPDATDKDYQTAFHSWWVNTLTKNKGGLRLTKDGYEAFQQADIKSYRVVYDNGPVYFINQLFVWLDQHVDCPYFITLDEIFVFSEKMAVQLMLFSGNIYKYGYAKQLSKNS